MKKNIDIKALLREGLKAAKKQHGILVEREEPELQEAYKRKEITQITQLPLTANSMGLTGVDKALLKTVGLEGEFDIVRNMPSIANSAMRKGQENKKDKRQQLRFAGMRDANIEKLFDKIRNGNSVQDPKETLKRLNTLIGMESVGRELGTKMNDPTVTGEGTDTDVFAALLLYKTIYDIVIENEAQSAGTAWEYFFSRLLGPQGEHLGGTGDIADAVYRSPGGKEGDVYYSLKLISEGTQITGSKRLLAKLIHEHKKIKYIIGIKSSPTKTGALEQPFYIRFQSIVVDETNWLQLIMDKSEDEVYSSTKGGRVPLKSQFAAIWDTASKQGIIRYAPSGEFDGKPSSDNGVFNINSYGPLFAAWLEKPNVMDLSTLGSEFALYKPPIKNASPPEVQGEGLIRLNESSVRITNKQWQDITADWNKVKENAKATAADFASGEVPFGNIKKFKEEMGGVQAAYDDMLNAIKTTQPADGLGLLEFFLLYSTISSVRPTTLGAGRKADPYSSLYTAILDEQDIYTLVQKISELPSPTDPKDKVAINTLKDNVAQLVDKTASADRDSTLQAAMKLILTNTLQDQTFNRDMAIKRIVTFDDNTEEIKKELSNQQEALRNILKKRFMGVIANSGAGDKEKIIATAGLEAIEDFSFNKYDYIKSPAARNIFDKILVLRKRYYDFLTGLKGAKPLKAAEDANRLNKAWEDRIVGNSVEAAAHYFPILLDRYSVKPSLKEEVTDTPDVDTAAEKEKIAKVEESGQFNFSPSKLRSQARFLKLDDEWPTITIEPRMAFNNAEEAKKALLGYIAPIFESVYYLNAGLVGYFAKDLESGLILSKRSIDYLKENVGSIDVDQATADKESAAANPQPEPEAVAENKALKRDELDDMIDELFK